jgi:hypothetical protein
MSPKTRWWPGCVSLMGVAVAARRYARSRASPRGWRRWLGGWPPKASPRWCWRPPASCWKPVWQVLEEQGFQLLLVNARQVKILPGRKTDVCDAAWLAELLEHGLLRGSFVPPAPIRELRDLTRYRKRPLPGPRRRGSAPPAGPWRTPASSWTRSPATCSVSKVGRCWRRWWAVSATLRCWPSWPRAGCADSSPSCARPCGAAFVPTTRCSSAWLWPTWSSWRPRSPSSTPTSTGCSLRSLQLGTGWTPSPGWASGPRRRSSPRSAPT